MALTGTQLAILTARAGVMRAGASRASYVPRNTVNSTGSAVGGFIRYKRIYPATIAYTVVKT